MPLFLGLQSLVQGEPIRPIDTVAGTGEGEANAIFRSHRLGFKKCEAGSCPCSLPSGAENRVTTEQEKLRDKEKLSPVTSLVPPIPAVFETTSTAGISVLRANKCLFKG